MTDQVLSKLPLFASQMSWPLASNPTKLGSDAVQRRRLIGRPLGNAAIAPMGNRAQVKQQEQNPINLITRALLSKRANSSHDDSGQAYAANSLSCNDAYYACLSARGLRGAKACRQAHDNCIGGIHTIFAPGIVGRPK